MLTFRSGNGLMCVGGAKSLGIFPKGETDTDLVLLSSPEEEPKAHRISWPGEYDIAGMTIRGLGQKEGQRIAFTVRLNNLRCAFLSSPLADWSDEEIERMGDIDLLALPGENPKVLQKLLEEVDPRMLFVLPPPKGAIDLDALKACGAEGKEQVTEYKLKGALPAEGREVVVFS